MICFWNVKWKVREVFHCIKSKWAHRGQWNELKTNTINLQSTGWMARLFNCLGVTKLKREGGQSSTSAVVFLFSVQEATESVFLRTGSVLQRRLLTAAHTSAVSPIRETVELDPEDRNAFRIQLWSSSAEGQRLWLKVSRCGEPLNRCRSKQEYLASDLLCELTGACSDTCIFQCMQTWVQSPCPTAGQKVSPKLLHKLEPFVIPDWHLVLLVSLCVCVWDDLVFTTDQMFCSVAFFFFKSNMPRVPKNSSSKHGEGPTKYHLCFIRKQQTKLFCFGYHIKIKCTLGVILT